MAGKTPQSGVTFALSDQAYALGASQCNDPNSYYTGSICACRPGYYQISGRCNQCPFASYYNGVDCIDTRTGLVAGQSVADSQISFNVNEDVSTFGQSKTVSFQNFGQSSTQQTTTGTVNVNGQQITLPPGAIPHNTVLPTQSVNQEQLQGLFIGTAPVGFGNQVVGQQQVASVSSVGNALSFNQQSNPTTVISVSTSGTPSGALPLGAYLQDGTNLADGQSLSQSFG